MKLKTHKIRNVKKAVCTCEQMIAYNYAFMYKTVGKQILEANAIEANKSQAFHDLRGF